MIKSRETSKRITEITKRMCCVLQMCCTLHSALHNTEIKAHFTWWVMKSNMEKSTGRTWALKSTDSASSESQHHNWWYSESSFLNSLRVLQKLKKKQMYFQKPLIQIWQRQALNKCYHLQRANWSVFITMLHSFIISPQMIQNVIIQS